MNIRIPSQSNPILKQSNDSSILGTLNSSFNLDLTTDLGKIKTTKTVLAKRGLTSTPGDFGGTQGEGVGAIATLSGQIWMISGDAIWRGGNSPSDTISKDTGIGTPTVYLQDSDLKGYNQTLIAASQTNLYKYTPGTVTWSSIHTFSTSGLAHLLETHGGYAYFTFDDYKIGRIDSSFTVSTSGTGTYNPNLPGYAISFMKSDGNRLWIGYMNVNGGANETTLIIAWDGSTENVASAVYKLNVRGVLAGCIVNGVPHVMDTNGRLLAFNGSFFQKIASLPLKKSEYLYGVGAKFNQRAIHPNGMTYDAITQEILINVSNVKPSGTEFYKFPGGVWSYTQDSGLIHKYSPSIQPIADTGATNLVEYGQYNTMINGAITCLGLRPDTGEKGRVLFGATVCLGTTFNFNDMASTPAVLCTDDTLVETQSNGMFKTSEIHSGTVDVWGDIMAFYKPLFSQTDKIVLKYRIKNHVGTTATITWSDIDRITTTTDVSAYSVGDEVMFVQGYGSGKSFTIQSITNNAGTYTVIFDDSMPSGVIGLTGVAVFDTWTKLGEITSYDTEQWKLFSTLQNNTSPFIQVKALMQFTGDNEMYGIYIKSNSLTN